MAMRVAGLLPLRLALRPPPCRRIAPRQPSAAWHCLAPAALLHPPTLLPSPPLQAGRRFAAAAESEEPTAEQAAAWHAEATKAAKGGELSEAAALYEKALRARIALLGEADEETDRTRHSLAATLENQLFDASMQEKGALKDKLEWTMTAGLEDLGGADYEVGGAAPDPYESFNMGDMGFGEGGGGLAGPGGPVDVSAPPATPHCATSARVLSVLQWPHDHPCGRRTSRTLSRKRWTPRTTSWTSCASRAGSHRTSASRERPALGTTTRRWG